jgi:hypothetical protein
VIRTRIKLQPQPKLLHKEIPKQFGRPLSKSARPNQRVQAPKPFKPIQFKKMLFPAQLCLLP